MKLILSMIILSGLICTAYADQFGVTLSATCIKMVQANITTDCPTYDEIGILFPDTTNNQVSGEFEFKDGMIKRGPAQMQKSWKYYSFESKNILWIDPPYDPRSGIKTITIEPSIPEYKLGAKSTQMNNYEIFFGKDRYINPNCSEISITAKNWIFLLGDTLNYLNHKCDPNFTAFNGTVSLKFEKSYQDISTSAKYIHDNWVKTNMEKCKVRGC